MKNNNDLSVSMQDYLEAILELESGENPVRITDIAVKLNIAKASVNQTIAKFKEKGLVTQQVYGPVKLTEIGRKTAESISQRHRKLRKFLAEVLGVDGSTAENDACMMEHAVSSQTMDKLTDFLIRNGYVAEEGDFIDTHSCSVDNNIIQKEVDKMNTATLVALSELRVGDRCKVIKVASKGTVRRRIMEMGLITGAEILVKGFAPFGDPMELGIKGYNLSLRKAEAAEILVELI